MRYNGRSYWKLEDGMTTDNDADSPNTWRAVGRLEANVERLVQGQERLV